MRKCANYIEFDPNELRVVSIQFQCVIVAYVDIRMCACDAVHFYTMHSSLCSKKKTRHTIQREKITHNLNCIQRTRYLIVILFYSRLGLCLSRLRLFAMSPLKPVSHIYFCCCCFVQCSKNERQVKGVCVCVVTRATNNPNANNGNRNTQTHKTYEQNHGPTRLLNNQITPLNSV